MAKKNKIKYDDSASNLTVTIEQKPVSLNLDENKIPVKSEQKKKIVELLIDQNDFIEERNKKLELWWNDDGREKIKELIVKHLYKSYDENYCVQLHFRFIDFKQCDDLNIGAYGYDYTFIRKKLWDEGINCKLALNGSIIVSVRKEDDYYDDNIFITKSPSVEYRFRDPMYLTLFSEYLNLTIEDVGLLIRKLYYSLPV